MIATLPTILFLPIEILWYLFGYSYVGISNGSNSDKQISQASLTSCCSSNTTPSLEQSLTEFSTQEEDGSDCSHCSDAVLQQIHQAISVTNNTSHHTLTLTNFVDSCQDSRDAVAIQEALHCSQERYHSIHLVDTVDATQYRRWNFKKTGIHRTLVQACGGSHLPLTYTTTVCIDTATMAPSAIVSLLKSLESDTDVKCLSLHGTLPYQDAETIALALVALLSYDQRVWKCLEWNIHIQQSSREAMLVERVCHKALQKVTQEKYITFNTTTR